MDGYAVRAADVVPGQPLKLIGTSQAGHRFVGLMGPGQCVRIFTGAPLPIGADAVMDDARKAVVGQRQHRVRIVRHDKPFSQLSQRPPTS